MAFLLFGLNVSAMAQPAPATFDTMHFPDWDVAVETVAGRAECAITTPLPAPFGLSRRSAGANTQLSLRNAAWQLGPDSRGTVVIQIGQERWSWPFSRSDAQTMTTTIPAANQDAFIRAFNAGGTISFVIGQERQQLTLPERRVVDGYMQCLVNLSSIALAQATASSRAAVAALAGGVPVQPCDTLAQPLRTAMGRLPALVDGVSFGQIDAAQARPACARAMAAYPAETRFIAYAARAADRADDDPETVRLLRLAAGRAHPTAMAQLGSGLMAPPFWGLAANEVEGLGLLRRAAELGDPLGQTGLGTLYYNGSGGVTKDQVEAVRLYRLAVAQGSAVGQTALAGAYLEGAGGLTKDDAEGVRLLRLAVAQGDDEAQGTLAAMLYAGSNGLTEDEVEAARLFLLSANQGNSDSQYFLSLLYGLGTGVALDARESLRWLRLAADQRHVGALEVLAQQYEAGNGVVRNLGETVRLLRLAAERDSIYAHSWLVRAYLDGTGVQRDPAESLRLTRRAVELGSGDAQGYLGLLNLNGEGGIARDDREAERLLRLAADQDVKEGQYGLGVLYEEGRGGLRRSLPEARRLYRLAADQGETRARDALARLDRPAR